MFQQREDAFLVLSRFAGEEGARRAERDGKVRGYARDAVREALTRRAARVDLSRLRER